MKVDALGERGVRSRLAGDGLALRCGPFQMRLQSRMPAVAASVARLYAHHPVAEGPFHDFHVAVRSPRGLRRWWRPQVRFEFDGEVPFHPLPAAQAFPILEWGLNWSVAVHSHQFLVLHAAVLARDQRALILPAPPGSGKSTLCAGLCHRGWRLLSDELALLRRCDGAVVPLPRPVSLKNASIPALAGFAPEARFGPSVHDTAKGTISHLRPPMESVRRQAEYAWPTWIVVPSFAASGEDGMRPQGRGRAFMALADNAFNYNVLGAEGFDLLAGVVDACACYQLDYRTLTGSVALLEGLAE